VGVGSGRGSFSNPNTNPSSFGSQGEGDGSFGLPSGISRGPSPIGGVDPSVGGMGGGGIEAGVDESGLDPALAGSGGMDDSAMP
jgi:hypothetical protein